MSCLRGYSTLWNKNGVSFFTLNYFWALSFEKIAKQVTEFNMPISPIDCCVRINHKYDGLTIKWWYSVLDILTVTASFSKLLYSWQFMDPSEHHSLNRVSTMLNNVFNYMYLFIFDFL